MRKRALVREFLRCKIHHARVTKADLDYEGSFGIDRDYMQQVGIMPYEAIEIYNVTTGARIRTYAIELPAGSRRFESNGAAAHHIRPGDNVIIACFGYFTEMEIPVLKPRVLILDDKNEPAQFFEGSIYTGDHPSPSPALSPREI